MQSWKTLALDMNTSRGFQASRRAGQLLHEIQLHAGLLLVVEIRYGINITVGRHLDDDPHVYMASSERMAFSKGIHLASPLTFQRIRVQGALVNKV